jgi:uncharacterized membrane protein
MRALKIIAFVIAAGLFIFGLLFILGSGSSKSSGDFITGIVLIVISFVLIFVGTRIKQPKTEQTNVTVNVDLPGNVSMDTIKCKSCGGVLAPKDIKMVAGAPVVTCPYCGTSYQLTEEPKW